MAQINVPQGFVEFCMEAMALAVKLRRDGVTQEIANVALERPMMKIEIAALCMLASVADAPTVENAKELKPHVLPGDGETTEL